MTEAAESEPIPSSSENIIALDTKDEDGPSSVKRRKISEKDQIEKLEHRLGGILCCAVCLDLPKAAVYQCTNGHLMCAPCFTHLLADARLRDESATCPNCRVEISKTSASRNLAVEKTVSELPSECKYCACVFPRHSLQHHEEQTCEDRQYKFSQLVVDSSPRARPLDGLVGMVSGLLYAVFGALRRPYLVSGAASAGAAAKRRRFRRATGCRYACIGCGWRGAEHARGAHEAACTLPRRSAAALVDELAERDRRAADARQLCDRLLDLLSYEKITFNDVQLKPYRTEEFVNNRLYYETARFAAFGHQWVVKAYVNRDSGAREVAHSVQREITYQLVLRTRVGGEGAVCLQWAALRGPWGEAGLRAALQAHAFSDEAPDAPPAPLPLQDPAHVNRLLAAKAIHFRAYFTVLVMFLSSK